MMLSPPERGRALVVVVEPASVPEVATSCLESAEHELAARFRFPKDAVHWKACRTALRHVAGEMLGRPPNEVRFKIGAYGKPSLDDVPKILDFNLSHCADLALIGWCCDGPIGIDVEPAARATTLLGCETAFCHPDEISGLPTRQSERAAALMKIWTAKEALLKAAGTGMSIDPATVMARGDPLFPAWYIRRLEHPWLENHLAALAAPVGVSEVDFVRWPSP